MSEKTLCPNCGAPLKRGNVCDYCGCSNAQGGIAEASRYQYENSVLERVLNHTLTIQKKHKKVILDIMLDQSDCLGGYCVQCVFCQSGVGLGALFKLRTRIQYKRFAKFEEKSLFTERSDGYYEFIFGIDIKSAATIIAKLFVEVYEVDISSLGYHIWCYNKEEFKDEYLDGNGNKITSKPIQKGSRHPDYTKGRITFKHVVISFLLAIGTSYFVMIALEDHDPMSGGSAGTLLTIVCFVVYMIIFSRQK